jgi:hypothetical protein
MLRRRVEDEVKVEAKVEEEDYWICFICSIKSGRKFSLISQTME